MGRRNRAKYLGVVREILVIDEEEATHDLARAVLPPFDLAVLRGASLPDWMDRIAQRPPAGIVLDITRPAPAGLPAVKRLKSAGCPSPVVAIGRALAVPQVVEAMKCGVADVLEKPLTPAALIACLRAATAPIGVALAEPEREPLPAAPERSRLTRREFEVLSHIAGGASNKEAGRLLGISPRTVEVHRARIMTKLGARNTADLVRIALSETRG